MGTLYLDIAFIIIFSLYLYWLYGLLRALKSDAPYVPIGREVLERMMQLVSPKSSDLWIDLGSGDGRVLIAASRRFGVRGLGIEKISALRTLSRFNILKAGLGRMIRIKSGDFFKTPLSQANVVSFYLLPETSKRLYEKLKAELRPGTTVLFHRYPIPGLPLVAEDEKLKIYVARF